MARAALEGENGMAPWPDRKTALSPQPGKRSAQVRQDRRHQGSEARDSPEARAQPTSPTDVPSVHRQNGTVTIGRPASGRVSPGETG